MIHLEQLEHLIAFYEEGTVTKAAERLLTSQPSLTRSLQRLEEELQAPLFHRQKNRLTLTETGVYAVHQARLLLEHRRDFFNSIQEHALRNTQLTVGVCAPGPIYWLEARANEQAILQKLHCSLQANEQLQRGLLEEQFSLIVTEKPLNAPNIRSVYFMSEQLLLTVPRTHPLATLNHLSFADLEGLTMLLQTNLGVWENVIQAFPQITFLAQDDRTMFHHLIHATELPHFQSNITQQYVASQPDRTAIPLIDPQATKQFYLSTLQKNQELLELFLPTENH